MPARKGECQPDKENAVQKGERSGRLSPFWTAFSFSGWHSPFLAEGEFFNLQLKPYHGEVDTSLCQ